MVPVNRGYNMGVNFMLSNAMKFFSNDTLFLVSIFDYNMFQICSILFIETFPKNAPCFLKDALFFPNIPLRQGC